MKFYPTSLGNVLDGCVRDSFLSQLERVNRSDSDYILLPITHDSNFVFNRDEFEIIKHKKFVILDFTEYGWNGRAPSHFYGVNTEQFHYLISNKEYLKLDEALKGVHIHAYFKRELNKNFYQPRFPVFPIEYLGRRGLEATVSFEEYKNRPIDIFFNWGWSNPSRPRLHGKLYELAEDLGYNIASDRSHIERLQRDEPHKKAVFSRFTPHFERMGEDEIYHLQRHSKIVISLNGCGIKCFRHAEAPVNSLMALQDNNLEWTYPWDNSNSILLENVDEEGYLVDSDKAVKKLISLLSDPNELYLRYVKGVENHKNYFQPNYINELQRRIRSV